MLDIFVIHSGSDRTQVERIVTDVKKEHYGANPLLLKPGGKLWKIEAKKKIKKAQLIVLFIGEKSHESPYIAWEIKEAKKQKKELISILLDESFKRHPALANKDAFSGQQTQYDRQMTVAELLDMIERYESIEYDLLNENGDALNTNLLFEQYKLFLQTSEALVARRQEVNKFYLSVNSAIVAFFSVVAAMSVSTAHKAVAGALFALLGAVLSIFWIRLLDSYGKLNKSKMKVISDIEKHLPASLFDAEWAVLSNALDKKKYTSFTTSETQIPKFFIAVYTLLLLATLLFYLLQ